MTIEINEKGSKAFYTEIVNVLAQYRFILRKQNYKLKDYFKQYKKLAAAGLIILVILALMMIFWGANTLDIVAASVLSLTVIICFFYLISLNRILKSLLNDSRSSVLTLDENGVELQKGDSQTVRIGWRNIAVIAAYKESLNFISADQTGIVISVDRRYASDIIGWLKDKQIQVEILEGIL